VDLVQFESVEHKGLLDHWVEAYDEKFCGHWTSLLKKTIAAARGGCQDKADSMGYYKTLRPVP
ncbi:MAG: hypothetical protein WA234_06970, partial [Rectinemataceae bacterium]